MVTPWLNHVGHIGKHVSSNIFDLWPHSSHLLMEHWHSSGLHETSVSCLPWSSLSPAFSWWCPLHNCVWVLLFGHAYRMCPVRCTLLRSITISQSLHVESHSSS